MNCIVCIDGDHAMKKLAQEKFDLIIIDYLLPGPNAVEVLSWARKQGIETPALIITNYPSDELTEKVKSLSSAQVLAKPLFDTFSMPAIVMKTLES
jgi:DNA-binding response OmpR family regulator